LCLFLAVGSIRFRLKSDRFSDLNGLFRTMPFTMIAFVVGGLSIIGVPPTCGFFSKWYLIKGGLAAGSYEFVAALLFSSLINVILFFRIIEISFFNPQSGGKNDDHTIPAASGINEAPLGMVATSLISATSLIVLGLYTNVLVGRVIQFVL
ncbi:MAG: monovalent cation/H+ antiporter subunit D family protein, partial [Deltaproteobacteria bacterium]|nr:monovalent cation/H+ antiporter subunit D family protein [Deltaproteobacteria bacterium]